MKKILLALFLTVAGLAPSFAQDYAPFRVGRTPYFQAGENIYSLRLATAYVQGTDSVFEFNPWVIALPGDTITDCYGNTSYAYGVRSYNNLFGQKMIRNSAGEYRFIFTSADTFLLKPTAAIGQSWQLWSGVTATMQSNSISQVQGMPDTVATISLNTGSSIQIGRKYGLVSAVPFYIYINSLTPAVSVQPVSLRLLPEAGIGQAVANPFRIYDFQVGDKFQYFYSWGTYTSTCQEKWITKEVISRYDSPGGDTIRYELKCQQLGINHGAPGAPYPFCNGNSGSFLTGFYTDTVLITASTDSMVYSLSQEYFPASSIPQPGWPYGLNIGMVAKNCNSYSRIHTKFYTHIAEVDTCTGTFQFTDPDNSGFLSYAEGLGKVRDLTGGFYFYDTELIAYIKGAETCGTWKAMVLSAEEEMAQQPLQIYPNPFTLELTLQLPEATSETAEVSIYNLQGQRVHQQPLLPAQTTQKVQLPSLPAGLYLLQVQQGEKSYTAKVQRQ